MLTFSKVRNPELKKYFVDNLAYTLKGISLGAPVVADVDRIVTSVNMKNGAYTIAAQPDVARNATVTATAGDTGDTMGTVTVVGKDSAGKDISEVITPVAGSTVAGAKAFASISSVTGAGWAIDAVEGTNDTITVGVGNLLGLPVALDATAYVAFGVLGAAVFAAVATADGTVAGTTIDMSSGTYNGSKKAFAMVLS
jgi:hypothetical protein